MPLDRGVEPPALLFVCGTCVRDGAGEAAGAGRRLADALRAALATGPTPLAVREVACLNACRSPCNVALRGHRRWTYRFSRCTLDDVPALLATARRYWAQPGGRITPAQLPDALGAKLSACVPPPT